MPTIARQLAAIGLAPQRSDPVSRWIVQLQQPSAGKRRPWLLPNKNARILWAVLANGRDYDPLHMPAKLPAPA